MKVIDTGTPLITLKNDDGEINMLMHSYNVYGDEIKIESQVRETSLKRGWVGDMIFYLPAGKDFQYGNIVEGTDVREVYHDILLRSVKIDNAEIGEATTWVYTFLKD